ncbi:hypothetical protein [Cystobacter fuscus]|uniref:hypothetical protein n=1 Tax=Cystobacter fuscus TaxID=43 RepID=UPI0005BB508D|nr:hypothetical protein [Cystobacter fuscus]
MDSVKDWLLAMLTGAPSAALFSWLFVESFKRLLDRSTQTSLESYKTQLQLESQSQLERHKSEIQMKATQQVEIIRHEMQKQMLRAQLSTTKTHTVYSKLIKLLLKAEGSVGSLMGAGYAPTFEKYSLEDFAKVLDEARAPGQEKKETLDLLERDRHEGIRRLEAYLRRRKIQDGRVDVAKARNYLLLEGIFITDTVRDLAFKACDSLGNAYVAANVSEMTKGMDGVGDYYSKHSKALDEAAGHLRMLQDAMRADLLPVGVGPPQAGPKTTDLPET